MKWGKAAGLHREHLKSLFAQHGKDYSNDFPLCDRLEEAQPRHCVSNLALPRSCPLMVATA